MRNSSNIDATFMETFIRPIQREEMRDREIAEKREIDNHGATREEAADARGRACTCARARARALTGTKREKIHARERSLPGTLLRFQAFATPARHRSLARSSSAEVTLSGGACCTRVLVRVASATLEVEIFRSM